MKLPGFAGSKAYGLINGRFFFFLRIGWDSRCAYLGLAKVAIQARVGRARLCGSCRSPNIEERKGGTVPD
jgi:hypothetical protein